MKYLRQFTIILEISFAGELLHHFLPLPVPGSIYGIVLLFLALYFKVLKVDQIRETSTFLIEIMPAMFIPASVGLINVWDVLRNNLFAYLMVIVLSTVLVMGVSGLLSQFMIRKGGQKQ
ncbi:MAG: CidA/LrgA family protein [Erysipelotrichaceae bacterium]|nr:CidA/LrgA family protein [Erysipelotrichaceae bacterium]